MGDTVETEKLFELSEIKIKSLLVKQFFASLVLIFLLSICGIAAGYFVFKLRFQGRSFSLNPLLDSNLLIIMFTVFLIIIVLKILRTYLLIKSTIKITEEKLLINTYIKKIEISKNEIDKILVYPINLLDMPDFKIQKEFVYVYIMKNKSSTDSGSKIMIKICKKRALESFVRDNLKLNVEIISH